jgi:hypothetical protein
MFLGLVTFSQLYFDHLFVLMVQYVLVEFVFGSEILSYSLVSYSSCIWYVWTV